VPEHAIPCWGGSHEIGGALRVAMLAVPVAGFADGDTNGVFRTRAEAEAWLA